MFLSFSKTILCLVLVHPGRQEIVLDMTEIVLDMTANTNLKSCTHACLVLRLNLVSMET